jgi:tryptophan synthase alpha chain
MTELRALLERMRAERRAALIPYIAAGDPDSEATVQRAEALFRGGADLLELGVPFSDPLADGPVIQRAAERALAAGTTVAEVLRIAALVSARAGRRVVLMSYVNPLLRYGFDRFSSDAARAGVAGVLLTDVPPEEAAPFLGPMRRDGLGTVFLVAPTSTESRIREAALASTGFLYCVSRLGVTGERERLSEAFRPVLEAVRRHTDLPVGLGFGISTPEQAAEAARVADAVIVGSALVAKAERAGSREAAVRDLEAAARDLRRAIDGARSGPGVAPGPPSP